MSVELDRFESREHRRCVARAVREVDLELGELALVLAPAGVASQRHANAVDADGATVRDDGQRAGDGVVGRAILRKEFGKGSLELKRQRLGARKKRRGRKRDGEEQPAQHERSTTSQSATPWNRVYFAEQFAEIIRTEETFSIWWPPLIRSEAEPLVVVEVAAGASPWSMPFATVPITSMR